MVLSAIRISPEVRPFVSAFSLGSYPLVTVKPCLISSDWVALMALGTSKSPLQIFPSKPIRDATM